MHLFVLLYHFSFRNQQITDPSGIFKVLKYGPSTRSNPWKVGCTVGEDLSLAGMKMAALLAPQPLQCDAAPAHYPLK